MSKPSAFLHCRETRFVLRFYLTYFFRHLRVHLADVSSFFDSVYRAVNIEEHRVAACKIIKLTEETTEKERKTIEKEMRIHAALKHENVLEFLNAVIVELKHKETYVPGFYMLMELAGGGDLFDKIGESCRFDDLSTCSSSDFDRKCHSSRGRGCERGRCTIIFHAVDLGHGTLFTSQVSPGIC